jgi:hypothetical protein
MASFLGLGQKKLTRIAITDDEGQFLELEATVSTNHEASATIVKHPIESGSNISDHISDEPDVVQIEGVVSNTPVLALASLRAEPSVPGGSPETRAEDAYEFLRRIKRRGLITTLVTKLRDYQNMAISKLTVPQDKDTSNIAALSIVFEEIFVAVTDTVDAPEPVNESRKPRSNQGRKPKKPAGAAAAAKSGSLTIRIGRFFGFIP